MCLPNPPSLSPEGTLDLWWIAFLCPWWSLTKITTWFYLWESCGSEVGICPAERICCFCFATDQGYFSLPGGLGLTQWSWAQLTCLPLSRAQHPDCSYCRCGSSGQPCLCPSPPHSPLLAEAPAYFAVLAKGAGGVGRGHP